MKKTKVRISSVGFILAIGLFLSGPAVYSTESDPFAYNEIRKRFSSKPDIVNYNRISGMLTDLLREHKRLFRLTGRTGNNEIVVKVEGLLNEAGLYASQNDNEKAYEIMDIAHKIIMESLKQMVGEMEK